MKNKIHCSKLYVKFKIWFNIIQPGIKPPDNKKFIKGINKYNNVIDIKINGSTQKGIRGIVMKNND